MLVTVGGENKVRIFDVADHYRQTDTVNVGSLPHGLWPSEDGKQLYVGLEFGDQVQHIDLQTMKLVATIQIGQSPQALVYADEATGGNEATSGLTALNDPAFTQVVEMSVAGTTTNEHGRLAIRPIGLTTLIEQIFTSLKPNSAYTLALSNSTVAPFEASYELNSFTTDEHGRYVGQSTGVIQKLDDQQGHQSYKRIILVNAKSGELILSDLR